VRNIPSMPSIHDPPDKLKARLVVCLQKLAALTDPHRRGTLNSVQFETAVRDLKADIERLQRRLDGEPLKPRSYRAKSLPPLAKMRTQPKASWTRTMRWQHIPAVERLARLEAHLEKLLAYKTSKTATSGAIKFDTKRRCAIPKAEIDKLKRQISGEEPIDGRGSFNEANPQRSIHGTWRRLA
jgi:hypothetical protein